MISKYNFMLVTDDCDSKGFLAFQSFWSWRDAYSETIKQIFSKINPERITLGTLRFEEGFYNMRNTIFTSGPDLPNFLENMQPMFSAKKFRGSKNPKSGKYSFTEKQRIDIFRFTIDQIRQNSDCKIALCKESKKVWKKTSLKLSKCSCVCQLDHANMA